MKTSIGNALILALPALMLSCKGSMVINDDTGWPFDAAYITDGRVPGQDGSTAADAGDQADGSGQTDGGASEDGGTTSDGGTVVKCTTGDECKPLGMFCDPTSGNCVACLQDDHCEKGKLCIAGMCETGCRSGRDCDAPLICDTTLGLHGRCVQCNLANPCTAPATNAATTSA